MHKYSDNFILSQIKYYESILGCGNSYDKMIIVGHFQSFQSEARKRNLI